MKVVELATQGFQQKRPILCKPTDNREVAHRGEDMNRQLPVIHALARTTHD